MLRRTLVVLLLPADEGVDGGSVSKPPAAADEDSSDLRCGRHIVERVCVEEDEIGFLAGGDRAGARAPEGSPSDEYNEKVDDLAGRVGVR